MGVNVNAETPLFNCANSLSNIHYLKSLPFFHQSPKYPNLFFSTHKKHTYTVLWELCKIEEKRRKREKQFK